MNMVRPVVDGNEFLLSTRDDPRDVFLLLVVMPGMDQILTSLDRKHQVDVNLGIGIGHEAILLSELVGVGWLPGVQALTGGISL
jgi:hypothetical protein